MNQTPKNGYFAKLVLWLVNLRRQFRLGAGLTEGSKFVEQKKTFMRLAGQLIVDQTCRLARDIHGPEAPTV